MDFPEFGTAISTTTATATSATATIRSGETKAVDNSNDADNRKKKQRGKLLKDRFDEYDLLQAYREIKSEYREKSFGGSINSSNSSSSNSSSNTQARQGGGDDGQIPMPMDNDDDDSSPRWRILATLDPNKGKRNDNNNNNKSNDDEIITVSMLEHPSDPLCPYVKMEAVIPIPVEKCWDFLSLDRWGETMPKMDPFYEGLDIYGEYAIKEDSEQDVEHEPKTRNKPRKRRQQSGHNENETTTKRSNSSSSNSSSNNSSSNNDLIRMVLARKRTKRILAFGKREFVFVSVEDKPLEDGTWVSGTVSVEVDESSLSSSSSDSSDRHCPSAETNDDNTTTNSNNDNTAYLPSLRRNKCYTRAFQDSMAFYKPVPSMASSPGEDASNNNNDTTSTRCCTRKGWTKLTIVCRIDLNDSNEEYGSGGCIPMWLYVKTIGKTGARSVLSMRQSLLAEYS